MNYQPEINELLVKRPDFYSLKYSQAKHNEKEIILQREALDYAVMIHIKEITQQNILKQLKRYPEYADLWFIYSGDQRSSPSWFFDTDKDLGHGFIVAYYDGEIKHKYHSDDKLEAASFFIFKKALQIAELQRLKSNKGKIL